MRRAGRPRRGWRAWERSAGVLAAPTGRRRPRARGRSRSCTWRAGSRKLASGVALSTFLFDLDGTLIDSIELILRSYRHTMRLHRGHEPPDDVWMTGLGTPLSVQFRHFTDDPAEIEAMVATYRAYNLTHHDELVRPYAGVVAAVRALRRPGRALGLVTSKMRSGALRGLQVAELADAFDVIVGSDEVTHPKPHPEPALAEHLGEPGALQPVRVGRAPALDPGAARPGRRLDAAAARGAARLQPVERHRPAARPDRRPVPGCHPRAGARHHGQRGGQLPRLLAAHRAGRQRRRDAPQLPADLGPRAELRGRGTRLRASRGSPLGAVRRRGAQRDHAGHEARGRDQPPQPHRPRAVGRDAQADRGPHGGGGRVVAGR